MPETDDSKRPKTKITITDNSAAPPAPVAEPSASRTDPDAEPETDKAVDDIMKQDGDDVLKAQDEATEKAVVMQSGRFERLKNLWSEWWSSPAKKWGTIGTLVVLIGVVFGLPVTRYDTLGLVLQAPVTVQTVDSKTGAPVSGVSVQLAGKTVETQADGKATFKVATGSKTLTVSKKYYSGTTTKKLVTLSGSSNTFKVSLLALGRQVKVKLVNKITGNPVAGASVSAGGGSTKTDANGLATLVVPSGADTQDVNVSLTGYNTAKVTVTAAGDLAKNTFSITPAGKLYFLSNLSGKIDVVKTNLDGTERATVLAGTGSEDKYTTSLLASRDWKYLALLSKRSGDTASVYLIDTTNGDKLTTIDEGDATYGLVGWSGDKFIYQVARNGVSNWQSNQQALKSFDPTTGHTLLLDQTQASGTSASDYAGQIFGTPYLVGDQVVYPKQWESSYNNAATELAGKTAELDTIGADGSGHKVVKTFTPDPAYSAYSSIEVQVQPYDPGGLYLAFEGNFYKYDDGKVDTTTDVTVDTFDSGNYPTYLFSPSGNSTFWSDQRDGKNTLFVGDNDAKNQKTIASLSDYKTYGWFTDSYLLVSKNSSELYIMPTSGGTPLKITDYYKPAVNYNGYGGGYGGL